MVSTRPPTSKSSSPFNNPSVTIPNAPITNGMIVPFMFHSFFNSLARSRYLSFFSHSFSFILLSAGIIIIIVIIPCQFFTLTLADDLSLEPMRQLVSSSLRDSSQYSGRSKKCCSLDSLGSSSDFQLFRLP